jgi:excisionase family DNA binding protein
MATSSKSQTTPVTRRAYRIGEACFALGICRSTAYERMDSGELPYAIIGGRRHIAADTIEALVRGELPGQAQPTAARRRKRKAAE